MLFASGDINFHLEIEDHYVVCFREILIMFNLIQYVNCSTHKMAHTLDLVLARCDSPIITNLTTENVYLSDRFVGIFDVESEVLKREVKTFTYRKIKSEKFCSDVNENKGFMHCQNFLLSSNTFKSRLL